MQRTLQPGDIVGYVNGKAIPAVGGGSEQPVQGGPASIPHTTVTADGAVMVGTDPRTTPVTFSPVTTGANPAVVPGKTFTAEDIEAARRQEKDKLYPEITAMKDQLAELQKERDDKLAAETKAREKAEKAAEDARKADTDTRTLLEQQEERFQARLAEIEAQRSQEQQVMAMERAFQELQTYKVQALAAASEDVIPQLANEITATQHTSREEVDAHIARLKVTSEAIMQEVQAAQQAVRAGMRGAPVTAPPSGPLDNYSGNDPVMEAAANGSLSFADFVKNRDRLIGSVSQARSQGLYG